MTQFDEQRQSSPEDAPEVAGEPQVSAEPELTEQPDVHTPEETEELVAEAELATEALQVDHELSVLNDRHLRLAAEFNNYRKRAQVEMGESWVRAQADLVRRLLDPMDDLRRVSEMDLTNATVEAIMEGIDLVDRKMMRVLAEVGGEEINPEGERFDPNTMEAMMRTPAASPEEDDTVDQVFQKGYVLKGHQVRPARVSVRKFD